MIGELTMATGFGELKVFSGSAHPELTREIAAVLGVQAGQARLKRFPDTEVSFQIDENIRGTDVFIVQPLSSPVNKSIMELLIMIDAFKRASAGRITAVVPSNDTDTPLPANFENIACVLVEPVAGVVVTGVVVVVVVVVVLVVAVDAVLVAVGAAGFDVDAAAWLHATTPAAIRASAATPMG